MNPGKSGSSRLPRGMKLMNEAEYLMKNYRDRTPSDISLVLTLKTSEMFAIFVFSTKTTQPRPQVFSVNGALTCKEAARLTSSVD